MNAKTQIIEKLQEQLIKTLDAEKANRICRILDEILAEFSICKISKRETKTDLLLDDFIQAKKLEGCSAKTLAYYKSTLEKLFISSKKIATEISSEDIRTYLSNFQTSRQVSKMTIDNNRRIFSTFFSWLENEDLIIMLACMGKIKEASYTASGLTDLKDCDVRRYLNTFNYLARINHKYSDGVKVKRYS